MDKKYVEKRKQELEAEFKKGAQLMDKLVAEHKAVQAKITELNTTLLRLQGAYAELTSQDKEVVNGKPGKNK
jgi:uncharacterized membrane-anchored protein YhcB (DUF1043 family)